MKRAAVVAAFSLVCAAEVAAQPTGGLAGRVTDSTGGSITGARVEVTGPAHKAATTDASGAYRIVGLPPGSYTVVVTRKQFAPFGRSDVAVTDGNVATLDVTLEIAKREETETVEGDVPLGLEPTASAGAIVLKGADLDALPDDPDELADALQALAGPSAGPNGGQIYVDGFSSGALPPKASIREIRINANPFSAEYDRLGFGRIEILTRPGTDRLRGNSSFEFMDGGFNSRDPFVTNRPPYQRREWGGNVGGPLAKKKGSFFVDFERRGVDDNQLVNATVLDPALNPQPFSVAVLAPQHRTTFSPRIDLQLGSRTTLVARYSYAESSRSEAGVGGFSLPSRGYDASSRQNMAQLTGTVILSNHVVNETRLQYLSDRNRQVGDDSIPTLQVLDAFTGGGSQVGLSRSDQDRLEIQNLTTWSRGKHALRAGARLRGTWVDDVSQNNFGGSVTFAGGIGPVLDANGQVLLGPDGLPMLATITSLERYRRTLLFQQMGLSAAQIRALGGGATQFRIAGGNPEATVNQWDVAPFVQDDWKLTPHFTLSAGLRYENQTNVHSEWNLAPRVAFAWAPQKGQERPRTVVRGGFGLFYDRFGEDLTLQAHRFDGFSQQQFLVTSPAVLDRMLFSADAVLDVPSAADLAAFALPQTTRRVAPDLQAPQTAQTSLSFEQLLPGNVTFSAVAVSTRIRRMLRSRNINAPLPGTGERPLGTTATVYQYESTGRFDQEQLIFGLNSRMSRTVTLFARYSLGRGRSDTDGAGSFPASSYDLAAEYGPSREDIRHRFTLGGSVRLPWDIRVSPLVVASSGRPFNITTGRDNNGDTLFTDRPGYATDPDKPGVVQTPWGLLDPNPGPGETVVPRNLGRGPSFLMVNLRLGKTFAWGKRPEGDTPQGGDGGPGRGGRGPGGGGPRGGGPRGGPGEGFGGREGGGGFGGPGDRPEGRVTLTVSMNAQNILNDVNLSPPVGNLSSPLFGQSLATVAGFGFGPGGGSSSAGNRRIELQARLGF